MAQTRTTQEQRTTPTGETNGAHDTRTARVIEVIGTSTEGFDDAIRNAVRDASETVRGIRGAHVLNMSVRCNDGEITEYKVDLKVAFGIERTTRT